MKNKNLLFKFGLITILIIGFSVSFTLATNFSLNLPGADEVYGNNINNNIVPVHFADNWNDFWWFMYITDLGTDDNEVVEWNLSKEIYNVSIGEWDIKYECESRVKGFYYNSERWERLWPLDWETAKTWSDMNMQKDLTTEWWIYTRCRPAGYSERLCVDCQRWVWSNGECECEKDDNGNCIIAETLCGEEPCPETDSAVCIRDLNEQYAAEFAFYGQVKHVYKGQKFGFVIWTDYKRESGENWISIKRWENGKVVLVPTFILAFSKVPMGFVYDYNGGIWFAWCKLIIDDDSPNPISDIRLTMSYLRKVILEGQLNEVFSYSDREGLNPKEPEQPEGEEDKYPDLRDRVECKDIWLAANSLIKVIVEWLVGMNRESDLEVMWNETDSKMQYFSSSDINNSTLVNYAKKKSEVLCRWKWKEIDDSRVVAINSDGVTVNDVDGVFLWSLACLDLGNKGIPVSAGLSAAIKDAWKTLIVKNGNVIVNPFTTDEANNSAYHDMFINNGDLVINETEGAQKFVFTTQWFISGDNVGDFISDVEEWVQNTPERVYMWKLSGVWLFIRWNFIVDGSVRGTADDGKLKNKYFIHGKFTTKDSFEDLKDIFIWRCVGWYVKDKAWNILTNQWKYCPRSIPCNRILGSECGWYAWINPYESASLVVIDQNYASPMYW